MSEWFLEINPKYIRDKERFVSSMKAHLDTAKVFASRSEKASEDNLEYLCRDIHKEHNAWYKLPCGHIKMISNSDFYRKVFTCYGCQVLKWEKEALESGMVFIEKVDGERVRYKINDCGHIITLPTYHVREYKKRNCEGCHIEELTSIANQQGVEFLRKAEKGTRKAVYRFKDCGHEHTLYTHHVKNGEISCPTCNPALRKRLKSLSQKGPFNENLDEEQFDKSMLSNAGKKASILKWKSEAEEKGLTFLCRDKDIGNYGWYQLPCQHIKRMSMVNVRNSKDVNNFHCSYCLETARVKIAREKGLELLEIINGDKAIYRFTTCGHSRAIYISDVERNNKLTCKDCVIEKWKKEAEEAGLTYIEKTEGKKALYHCHECDTKQEFHVIAVRNKEFICKGCKNKNEH